MIFDFNKGSNFKKIENPLGIQKDSMMEFSAGFLANTGMYRFKKMITFYADGKKFTRYLLYSNLENKEYIFEVFLSTNGQKETYLYQLYDTVPFSEDFLNVVGQLYFTTPEGEEFQRTVMPNSEEWIDGVQATIQIYDLESDQVEKRLSVLLWDYQREVDGVNQVLNVEMSKDNGVFKIFVGEHIEDIFYKILNTSGTGGKL